MMPDHESRLFNRNSSRASGARLLLMAVPAHFLLAMASLAGEPGPGSGEGPLGPPVCITQDHPLRSGSDAGSKILSCSPIGACDLPANRDAAIPHAETPIKYITVNFQSVSRDDGSGPTFSRSQAVAAIDWLNLCYEPWRIQFTFDHRIVYSSYFHDIDNWRFVNDLGAQFSTDTRHNLNILTTNFWCEWEGQVTLCGGAPYPWSSLTGAPLWSVLMTTNHWPHDGLICHEVGHSFGLIHTFGDFEVQACGPCDEVVGAGNGDSTGDFCSDTPPTPVSPWNIRCAPAPGTDQCSGRPWGETDYRNWMAYTPYAPCKDHFTPQQAGRMHCWLEARRPDWISYAKIDSDVDFGRAPLSVEFAGISSLTPDNWTWDFGDGTSAVGQSQNHVYQAPGIYRPRVTLSTAEGEFEATMSREVWVYADDLVIENRVVSPGDQPFGISIQVKTSIPVDSVYLPLAWDGQADLALDSVSTAGLRSASFPAPQWQDLDTANKRGCLRLRTVDSLAMEPGDGRLVNLWFTADPNLSTADNAIRVENYGTCQTRFVTDRGRYVPQVTNGHLSIRKDVSRTPSGSHQP